MDLIKENKVSCNNCKNNYIIIEAYTGGFGAYICGDCLKIPQKMQIFGEPKKKHICSICGVEFFNKKYTGNNPKCFKCLEYEKKEDFQYYLPQTCLYEDGYCGGNTTKKSENEGWICDNHRLALSEIN